MGQRIRRNCVLAFSVGLGVGGCFQPAVGNVDLFDSDGSATDGSESRGASSLTGQGGTAGSGSAGDGATSAGPGGGPDPTAGPDSSGDGATTSEDPLDTTAADETSTSASSDATTTEATTGPSLTSGTDGATTTGDSTSDTEGGSEGPCVPRCEELACGLDPVCGISCGGCEQGELCLDDGDFCGRRAGYPDDFGFSRLVAAEILFGHRFSLGVAVTLKRLGVIAGGPGAVRMALYSHANGPERLLAQTGSFSLLAGRNEQAVTDVELPAGDYWVGIVAQSTTSLGATADDSGEAFWFRMNYGDPFPATLAEEAVIADRRYNLYVVVDDG